MCWQTEGNNCLHASKLCVHLIDHPSLITWIPCDDQLLKKKTSVTCPYTFYYTPYIAICSPHLPVIWPSVPPQPPSFYLLTAYSKITGGLFLFIWFPTYTCLPTHLRLYIVAHYLVPFVCTLFTLHRHRSLTNDNHVPLVRFSQRRSTSLPFTSFDIFSGFAPYS